MGLSSLNPYSSVTSETPHQWLGSCTLLTCLPPTASVGCNLTILYGSTAVAPTAAPKKKKRSLLPLLTVVFIFSYGLMTMLIVEQGSAIQAQHNLITVLMRDSRELWTAKGKAIVQRHAEEAASGSRAPGAQAQAPSDQTPSNQAQSNQAPASQSPKHRAQNHAGKTARPGMEVPPAPASDLVDRRRSLTTI
jgi:hypothetical protein